MKMLFFPSLAILFGFHFLTES